MIKDKRGGKNKLVTINPFKLGEEPSDYWIGYIGADGFLSTKKYLIGLKSKDIDHMEKYKTFVGGNVKLRYEINTAGSNIGIVNFGNFDIYYHLLKLGITPRKSKTFKYDIPLNGHILRGHFDGDGSISQNRPKITTGSLNFKNQLIEYYDSLGIKYSVFEKGIDIWDIYVMKDSRLKFFQLLYTNATIFLNRKYDKFAALVSNN